VLAEATTLVACAVALGRWRVELSAAWRPVLDYGGSLLICILAPCVAFGMVRRMREDARRISWAFLLPTFAANVGLATLVSRLPEGVAATWPRWALLLASVCLPSSGAPIGTFIPTGSITIGRHDTPRGVRIT